jgi:ABC-2 type transport system permease protein
MTTEFFSWAPVLAIIIAIAGGSYAVAGEEANGTLDLLLAQPISRASLLLQKCLALCLAILIAASASVIGFIVGKTRVEMGLSIGQFAQGVANIVPLALLFLGMALWASAALPTRSGAAMLVTGIVVLSFFLQLLGQSVPALATARKISPFYWAEPSRVLIHGFDWLRSFALLGLAALFLGLALWSLERRAIGTGSREWNWRPRLQWIGRLERPYRHLTEPAS